MAEPRVSPLNFYVAGRGESGHHGLHIASERGSRWEVRQLDTVEQLAALCAHPYLPVIYGLSGMARGRLHAWDARDVLGGGAVSRLVDLDCMGDIPCDLAVDPTGRLLIAANYGFEAAGGSLTVWQLDARGVARGGITVPLSGSGSDPSRQGVAHPHQVVFSEGLLYVPDLGAELIRRYRLEPHLHELTPIETPAGMGPRHMVVLGGGEIVVSGELDGSIGMARADPDAPGWRVAAGTLRTGPATSRSERNYPGDIKLSMDGRFAYFANRGYDTISAFALESDGPRLIAEVAAGVAWPQHMLVRDDQLFVAGWDGSAVARIPLTNGVPGRAALAFPCDGAGWLLSSPV
jgi:6-phosphogluconolactonase